MNSKKKPIGRTENIDRKSFSTDIEESRWIRNPVIIFSMSIDLNRREFLKLTSLLPFTYLHPKKKALETLQSPNDKNIIILLFDSLSALDISLYGFQRDTMPNLARLAERSTVYHNHYSGGNYTTPGTASLLTGTYPWTHGAIRLGETVSEDYVKKNIFSQFDSHYRLAYTHNPLANNLLHQFTESISHHKRREDLFIGNSFISDLFKNDNDMATLSWDRIINIRPNNQQGSYSMLLSKIFTEVVQNAVEIYENDFPLGPPEVSTGLNRHFLLEHAIDWAQSQLAITPNPVLFYFHLLPPHEPYRTRRDFVKRFVDGWVPQTKPRHLFGDEALPDGMSNSRRNYDEFILYADAEFGRLYGWLEHQGFLENSWIVFTSDHGQMFERGTIGHITPLLHQPVIKIPLLISSPGQQSRQDIHVPTNAVDVLPTLLQVNDKPIPEWIEGKVMPPFSGDADGSDPVFTLEGKRNPNKPPLEEGSLMMIQWPYKLIYYFGYKKLEDQPTYFELYNLENDPDEMINIVSAEPGIFNEFREVLEAKIAIYNGS